MAEILDPIHNQLNAPFWAAAEAGRLTLPTCTATGRAFWPPSPVSPFVTSGAVEWRAFKAVGRLLSVVVYRRVFQRTFEPLTPYGVGLVELDCGPRLMAHVPNPDDPDAPRAGQRARLDFIRLFDGGPAIPALFQLNARDSAMQGRPK